MLNFLGNTDKQLKRMPFDEPPLRDAGQSLHDANQKLLLKAIFLLSAVGVCFPIVYLVLWLVRLFPILNNPTLWGISALPICGIMLLKMKSYEKELNCNNLGALGERIVGAELEKLRVLGYEIYHDVIAERSDGAKFNLDHVAIGPAGAIVFETKARSKPNKGQTEIYFDGKSVSINNGSKDPAPVNQVTANAKWLEKLLFELTGKKFPVTGVLVYPGWFIKYDGQISSPYCTNHKLLSNLIGNKDRLPDRLSPDKYRRLQQQFTKHLRDQRRHLLETT